MIKVLVIDDSATMRIVLKKLIDKNEYMECIGVAPNPVEAKEMIRECRPDVITLDVEMPKMSGLEFLERMMHLTPIPVIMISTMTEAGSEAALRSLELGAVDFIAKPKLDMAESIDGYAAEIYRKIQIAATAKIGKLSTPLPAMSLSDATPVKKEQAVARVDDKIVALGAGTGGVSALREILMLMPEDCPPMLVVQHLPAVFMGSLAKRLDQLCLARVKIAEHGEFVRKGCIYVSSGDSNLMIKATNEGYRIECVSLGESGRVQSSVDALFSSLASAAGKNGIGVILTGAGKDGAEGMRLMMEAGAFNIAQSADCCVVFDMPKSAISSCGITEILSLSDISTRILN
ncbi:protein-glutamate methylesterase/protein-glutamine glutaminase [Chromobacterium haemolyticum]|uniref:protein-glutamate methylesterase/protein-glutamine glutaminase n=1 Tax=Chromobacterium haemolyticum TaxID=394935 RepID=UPI0009DA4673|nr:chemotaxis response regulator protein-glutamate methylesterase [Chromobacterium haemolyticum]OQS31249.1 chemotaxis response regulator protein-glutamate methylesterase [Chromobacterium haemolyticum]